MGLRDVAVALVLFGSLPFCVLRPWIGLLVWAWIAYMNPHRQAWGFAYDMPFAQWVAIATLLGFVVSRGDRKPFVWSAPIVLLIAFWAWTTATTFFAMYPDAAMKKYEEFFKIQLMTVIGVPLFQDRGRIRLLLLVIAGSLAYYGAKGGVFALVTGGAYMVLGPKDTFIEANTELSLALNMSIPLLFFLARDVQNKWAARGLRVCGLLTIVAVPFTYSRSGMIGLVVVLFVLLLKSKKKKILLPAMAAGALALVVLAPAAWMERVQTIKAATEGEDESLNLRKMSWEVGTLIALDHPLFGGGFKAFTDVRTYTKYMPHYPRLLERGFAHDAHSIYFNILGEHGYIGITLFGALIVTTFVTLRRVHRISRQSPDLAWAKAYADMFEVCLIAWLVTGITLSAAYFDLAYQILVLSAVLCAVVAREAAAAAGRATTGTATPPVEPTPVPARPRLRLAGI